MKSQSWIDNQEYYCNYCKNISCLTKNLQLNHEKKILYDIEEENDLSNNNFEKYATAISNIVSDSEPNFSIGIYGPWGTGKTTLMKHIYKKYKENFDKLKKDENPEIIPVWFNAWRYERETQFALVPLLKTIEYAIPKEKENLKSLRESFKDAGLFALKLTNEAVTSIISSYMGNTVGTIFKKSVDRFTGNILDDLKKVDENIVRNTIYYEGLEKIKNAMESISKENKKLKIVVFIDDLDRCSPEKALQVFESVKVFFGIEGFIYIIGLTYESISKLIDPKKFGQAGNEYVKKIIQVPINIPSWNEDKIKKLINYYTKDFSSFYTNMFSKEVYQNLISLAVENNPRQLKRFINNYVFSYEIFSGEISGEELLILETINNKWAEFYYNLTFLNKSQLIELNKTITDDFKNIAKLGKKLSFYRKENNTINLEYIKQNEFFKNLIGYIKEDYLINLFRENLISQIEDTILKSLFRKKQLSPAIDQDVKIIMNYLLEYDDLKDFMRDHLERILHIGIEHNDKWEKYKEAIDSINKNSTIINTEIKKDVALDLIRGGNISEFNKTRKMYTKLPVKLEGEDLSGLDLHSINLRYSELPNADLSDTNLSNSDLLNSNLKNCDFTDSDLSKSNLSYSDFHDAYLIRTKLTKSYLLNVNLVNAQLEEAILDYADLSGSNLMYSNLEYADLHETDLSGINLQNADLSYADLSNANFDKADLNGTNLSFSILLGCKSFNEAKNISGATYEGTIIDEKLFKCLKISKDSSQNTKLKGEPYVIKDEDDLRNKLKKYDYSEAKIKYLISSASFSNDK